MSLLPTDVPLEVSVLAAQVRAGRLDPVDLLEQSLARIAEVDGDVGAFVHLDAEAARVRARAARGSQGRLAGVPLAVKDIMDVAGQRTRAGSRVEPGPAAAVDAAMVARVRAAGAVLVGRTRTHEFAWGVTTQHEVLGGTANPYDLGRVPGGSSGGSAAAVAAAMVPVALGTDTACSIRLPAAWCGLVGHKATHGLVPLDGVVPLAPSLDHGGALVRTVADARLLLEVLAGIALPASPVRGLRLGVVTDGAPAQESVLAAVAAAAGRASGAGMVVRSIRLPDLAPLPALYSAVQAAEALGWHTGTGRWPAQADRYGSDVRGHLQRAEQVDAAATARARADRLQLRQEMDALWGEVDVLLTPVAAGGPSTRVDPTRVLLGGVDVPVRDSVLPWSVPAPLCGLPACAVPAGLDQDGLPIGLQVIGPRGTDARVLDVAGALETR